MEKESGLISTSFVVAGLGHGYESCSKNALMTLANTRIKLNAFVKSSSPNSATVTINSHIEGLIKPMSGIGNWENCNSTGVLERELFAKIRARFHKISLAWLSFPTPIWVCQVYNHLKNNPIVWKIKSFPYEELGVGIIPGF